MTVGGKSEQMCSRSNAACNRSSESFMIKVFWLTPPYCSPLQTRTLHHSSCDNHSCSIVVRPHAIAKDKKSPDRNSYSRFKLDDELAFNSTHFSHQKRWIIPEATSLWRVFTTTLYLLAWRSAYQVVHFYEHDWLYHSRRGWLRGMDWNVLFGTNQLKDPHDQELKSTTTFFNEFDQLYHSRVDFPSCSWHSTAFPFRYLRLPLTETEGLPVKAG